jgi:hypothetical protein
MLPMEEMALCLVRVEVLHQGEPIGEPQWDVKDVRDVSEGKPCLCPLDQEVTVFWPLLRNKTATEGVDAKETDLVVYR